MGRRISGVCEPTSCIYIFVMLRNSIIVSPSTCAVNYNVYASLTALHRQCEWCVILILTWESSVERQRRLDTNHHKSTISLLKYFDGFIGDTSHQDMNLGCLHEPFGICNYHDVKNGHHLSWYARIKSDISWCCGILNLSWRDEETDKLNQILVLQCFQRLMHSSTIHGCRATVQCLGPAGFQLAQIEWQ